MTGVTKLEGGGRSPTVMLLCG